MSDPFRGISAPREDSWVNLVTGLGTVSRDKTVNTLFCRDLVLAEEDCAALYAHDDLAKKIVDAPLDEAFRKGFKLKAMKEDGTEDEDKSKELRELVCLLEKTARDTFRWARVFGGAGAIANVNGGGAWNSALNPEAVSAVISTPVFDRRFLWPVDLYDDPVTLWREPLTYALATNGFTAKQARAIHESRIFRVVGVEADRRDRQTLNYWGYSALQPVYNTLRRYATADQSALQLLMDASQFVFKIKGVIAAIESGNKKVLQDRMALVDMSRGIGKALILDAEAQEGVERSSASFAGIPDLLDKFMARLAAACGIPVSVLFGVGPAGLNATGELDMEVWRSSIASFQVKELTPFIKRLLCLYANEWDFDPEMVEIDWMPLSEPTMAQTADVRLKVAQADQIYFNMGLPMEVILKSRFANGFSMETEVDVDELDEIAAQAEEDKQAQADLAMAQAKAPKPGGGPKDPLAQMDAKVSVAELEQTVKAAGRPLTSKEIAEAHGMKGRSAAIAVAKQSTVLHESKGYGGERVYSHPAYHKAAGEHSLALAKESLAEGKTIQAGNAMAQAEKHAALAGGEWDEAKHPRDENGKFA